MRFAVKVPTKVPPSLSVPLTGTLVRSAARPDFPSPGGTFDVAEASLGALAR